MKTVVCASLVAAALVAGPLGLTAARTASLKHVVSMYFDEKGTGLNLPEGVACDARGQVVVGDTGNDRLVRFYYRDKVVSGGTVIKIAELSAPSRVQLTSKGEIYALDSRQRRVAHLGSDGAFKGMVAFDGVPDPATIVAKDFAIDQADNLYVLDVFSARVLVLDGLGKFQRMLTVPDGTSFVSHMAVDAAGNVFLLDSIQRRLFSAARGATSFTPLGAELTQSLATLPSSITASKGTIFVAEGPGSTIAAFGSDGSFLAKQLKQGWDEGALNQPSQICINDKDDVFVADRDNSRIQVFRLTR